MATVVLLSVEPPRTSTASWPFTSLAGDVLAARCSGGTNGRGTPPSFARFVATGRDRMRTVINRGRMVVLRFFAMRGEQGLERGEVDFAVHVQAAEGAFELAHRCVAVEDLDLGNQPIEPQAHGGIRNGVGLGELFERSRSQDKALEEREVFFVQQLDPTMSGSHDIILNNTCILFNTGCSFVLVLFRRLK